MIRKYIIFSLFIIFFGCASFANGYITPYSPENHLNQWNSNFGTYLDGNKIGFNVFDNKHFGYPFSKIPEIASSSNYSDDCFNFTIGEAEWVYGYEYKFVSYTNVSENVAYFRQKLEEDHTSAIQSFSNQSTNPIYTSIYYSDNFSENGFLSYYVELEDQLFLNDEGDELGFSGKKYIGSFGFVNSTSYTDEFYLFFIMHDENFFYIYDQNLGDIPIAILNGSLWYKISFIWNSGSTVLHIYDTSSNIESVIDVYDIGYSIPIEVSDFEYFYTICLCSIPDENAFFSIDGFVREPYAWDLAGISGWKCPEFIGINATYASINISIPFGSLNFGYFQVSDTDINTMYASRVLLFFRNPFEDDYGIFANFLVVTEDYGVFSKGIYMGINGGSLSKVSENYSFAITVYCDKNNTIMLNEDEITPLECDGFPEFIGNQSDITIVMEMHSKSISGFGVSMITNGIMQYPILSISYTAYNALYYSYILVNSCLYIGSGSGLFLGNDLIRPIYNGSNIIFVRADSIDLVENKSYTIRIYAIDGSLFMNSIINITFNYDWKNNIGDENAFSRWLLESWNILLIIFLSIVIAIFASMKFRREKIHPTSPIFGNSSETFITYGGRIPNRCNITKNGIQCDYPKSISEQFKN